MDVKGKPELQAPQWGQFQGLFGTINPGKTGSGLLASSNLPAISKLDSDDESPKAGSEDDLNLSCDEGEDLSALTNMMSRNSVVGASSGRGPSKAKLEESLVCQIPTTFTT